ncbi:MAG: hypothetical protein AAFY64_06125 [Pseudomonadota bacterium]
MAKIPLRELAHARAGDKGNVSSISVWPYDPGDYALLKRELTAERVKAAYPNLFTGPVIRHEMDELGGLNFVMHDALEGGVNTSLNLDGHGKSWSFLLLALEINVPDNLAEHDGQP